MTDLGWSTNTDWTNAQSSENIDINSGTFELADAIPDSGVSRWEFEQDLTDSWGNNDATDNTSAGYTTDAAVGEYAKTFDGQGYLDIGNIPEMEDIPEATITGWVNFDQIPDSDLEIIGNFNSISFENAFALSYRNSTNNVRFIFEKNNNLVEVTTSPPNTGTWVHYSMVFDGSVEFYVDGSSVGSDSTTVSTTPVISYTMGGRVFKDRYFDGVIDDPRMYSKALSDSEVSNLYNTGSISG